MFIIMNFLIKYVQKYIIFRFIKTFIDFIKFEFKKKYI